MRDTESRILDLIRNAKGTRGGRICVLGAGNCNDLDLAALTEYFNEVHLVDLDLEALENALVRQQPPTGRVVLHTPCDLMKTGAAELERPYDVVLSAGLLTQLFQTIEDLGLPEDLELQRVLELRNLHLRLLFDLLVPGGAFVLVTDVVSTATAPELPSLPEARLPDRLSELIEAHNFFTGANPAAIWRELTEQPEFTERSEKVESHDPWLWPITDSHHYLTWAVTVRTRPHSICPPA